MISPLANVSSKAQIGNNVTIEAFATIYDDVVIGDNTHIHPNAIIYPDTTIGNDCQIFPGALVGIVSQDLKYKGEKAKTVIGNNTIIREYATVQHPINPALIRWHILHSINVYINTQHGNTWANQASMANILGVHTAVAIRHIKAIGGCRVNNNYLM